MLQIKTIPLGNDDEINQFLATHHVIQQGVNIKEKNVVVLFDDSFFEERDRKLLLNMSAGSFRRKLLEKDIECRYWDAAVNAGKGDQIVTVAQGEGMPGRPMTTYEAQANAKKGRQDIDAQLWVVENMIMEIAPELDKNRPIFGKKIYPTKEVEATETHVDSKDD